MATPAQIGGAPVRALSPTPTADRPTFFNMHPDGSQLCSRCQERPATRAWGDAMVINHGGGEWRCDICALTEQLDHARERAAAIPELERQLADALHAAGRPGAERPVRAPQPANRTPLPAPIPIDDARPVPAAPRDPSRDPQAQRETALRAAVGVVQDHVVGLLAHAGKSEIGSVGYKTEAAIALYDGQLRALGNAAWRRRVIRELQDIDQDAR